MKVTRETIYFFFFFFFFSFCCFEFHLFAEGAKTTLLAARERRCQRFCRDERLKRLQARLPSASLDDYLEHPNPYP